MQSHFADTFCSVTINFIQILWSSLQAANRSKFMGYPGRDHRQRVKTFFEKKQGDNTFSKKIKGRIILSRKKEGGKDFFENNLYKPVKPGELVNT